MFTKEGGLATPAEMLNESKVYRLGSTDNASVGLGGRRSDNPLKRKVSDDLPYGAYPLPVEVEGLGKIWHLPTEESKFHIKLPEAHSKIYAQPKQRVKRVVPTTTTETTRPGWNASTRSSTTGGSALKARKRIVRPPTFQLHGTVSSADALARLPQAEVTNGELAKRFAAEPVKAETKVVGASEVRREVIVCETSTHPRNIRAPVDCSPPEAIVGLVDTSDSGLPNAMYNYNPGNQTTTVFWEEWSLPVIKTHGSRPEVGVLPTLKNAPSLGWEHSDGERHTVRLPRGLVHQLQLVLIHQPLDSEYKNYKLMVARTHAVCLPLRLTPEQLTQTVSYAPVIAYHLTKNAAPAIQTLLDGRFTTPSLIPSSPGDIAASVLTTVAGAAITHTMAGAVGIALSAVTGIAIPLSITGYQVYNVLRRKWGLSGATVTPVLAGGDLASGITKATVCDPRQITRCFQHARAYDATKPTLVQAGPSVAGYTPLAFSSNAHNELASLKYRVLNPPGNPSESHMDEFVRFVKGNACHLFGGAVKVDPLPFDAWLAGCNSSPSVKARLRRAHTERVLASTYNNGPLKPADVKRYIRREYSIKQEKLALRSPAGVAAKAPRGIQAADPNFTITTGPFITALQGLIKSRWGLDSLAVFGPAVDVLSMGNLVAGCHQRFDHSGEDDFANYDASFREKILALEVWLCKRFGANESVQQLMAANIATRGITAHGWKYKAKGGRKSGDTYTTLMNSIVNALLHVYAFCRNQRSLTRAMSRHFTDAEWAYVRANLKMVVTGDDNLFFHNGPKIDFNAVFDPLGFSAVCHYKTRLVDLEFCSNHLLPCAEGHVFVPKAGRQLALSGWFVNIDPDDQQLHLDLLRGTALSGRHLVGFHPIIGPLYQRLLDFTPHAINVPVIEPWKMSTVRPDGKQLVLTATEETMHAVCERYHLSVTDVESAVRSIRALKTRNSNLDNHAVTIMCDYDVDGPEFIRKMAYDTFHKEVNFDSMIDTAGGSIVGDAAVLTVLDAVEGREEESRKRDRQFENDVFSVDESLVTTGFRVDDEYLRDLLLRQGVEPNPGPKGGQGRGRGGRSARGQRAPRRAAPRAPAPRKTRKLRSGKRLTQGVKGSGAYGLFGNIGRAIDTVTGGGDYAVTTNSLYSGQVTSAGPPVFVSHNKSGSGNTRIRHREPFLGAFSTPGVDFSLQSYTINPTNAELFPWLSGIAAQYEQFKIWGLIFEFVTNSATAVASTNTALGTVVMATQYNVLENAFTSKTQMEQYEFSVAGPPSNSLMHPVECAPSERSTNMLFCDLTTGGGDPRFSVLGKLNLATSGMQSASVIGEMWVTYDIELVKPRMANAVSNQGLYYHAYLNGAAAKADPNKYTAGGQKNVFGFLNSAGLVVAPDSNFEVTYALNGDVSSIDIGRKGEQVSGSFLIECTMSWWGVGSPPVSNAAIGFGVINGTVLTYFPSQTDTTWTGSLVQSQVFPVPGSISGILSTGAFSNTFRTVVQSTPGVADPMRVQLAYFGTDSGSLTPYYNTACELIVTQISGDD